MGESEGWQLPEPDLAAGAREYTSNDLFYVGLSVSSSRISPFVTARDDFQGEFILFNDRWRTWPPHLTTSHGAASGVWRLTLASHGLPRPPTASRQSPKQRQGHQLRAQPDTAYLQLAPLPPATLSETATSLRNVPAAHVGTHGNGLLQCFPSLPIQVPAPHVPGSSRLTGPGRTL